MSVLVFAESWEGKFKKSTFEAISYASELSKTLGTTTVAIAIGRISQEDLQTLGKFGANKILHVSDDKLSSLISQAYTSIITQAAKKENAQVVIISNTYSGKAIAPGLSIKLQAGLISGAIALPSNTSPFTVRKKCFSGKALTDIVLSTEIKIIAIAPNSFKIITSQVSSTIEPFNVQLNDKDFRTQIKEVRKTSGKVVLTEAEIIVSAGRGLKGQENWPMIEQLAEELGAATACSKPVADVGWRPHHEHVGQTGITVSPNLYIAIGISGAIQHLAGVNSSKVIVVINNDPEAPFFKAADYGIAGDAFEIVPKLIKAIKNFKDAHN